MTGKYPGGDYENLGNGLNGAPGDGSDLGIDYFEVIAGSDSDQYRPATGVEAYTPRIAGVDRGAFDVEVNYVVAWNDAGDWRNYTRVFSEPARDYNVYGRLSSGGKAIAVQLDEVTAGSKTADQTLKKLGVFNPGRATGDWEAFEFFPLTDDRGNLSVVTLGGERTLVSQIFPAIATPTSWRLFRQ